MCTGENTGVTVVDFLNVFWKANNGDDDIDLSCEYLWRIRPLCA